MFFDEVQKILNRILDTYPADVTWEVYHILGIVFWLTDDIHRAETQFVSSIEQDDSYAFVHNNLGNVLYTQGRIQEAVVSYLKALEIQEHYA